MDVPQVFDSEYRLAKIIWERAPMTTRALVEQADKQLNWKHWAFPANPSAKILLRAGK